MNAFRPYVKTLTELYSSAASGGLAPGLLPVIEEALDGGPRRALRELVPLQLRRSTGAFFTGGDLVRPVLAGFVKSMNSQSRILDPACGVGDLLISCARLWAEGAPAAEISALSRNLAGLDREPEFIEAARIRLALWHLTAAQTRDLPKCKPADFSQIRTGDTLDDAEQLGVATHILLNPPFNMIRTQATPFCGPGLVSSAALFVAHVIENSSPGCRVLAILPDVLRSGSRYRAWREYISGKAKFGRTILLGQFDRYTDVDVFAQELEVALPKRRAPIVSRSSPKETVSKKYNVSVGAVVDYRDPKVGVKRPYATAKSLPAWTVIRRIGKRRAFVGKVVEGPFIVVRRTSRVGDRYRALAAIVQTRRPVAVDNHLIVIQPKNGKLSACIYLLRILRRDSTNRWLDQRIRCRHLTVAAVSELPIERSQK